MGKYMVEAGEYNDNVSSIIRDLDNAQQKLEMVDKMLGIDPENSKDVLSYNVIISNGEIKEELDGLVSDLNNYTGLVSSEAKIIDARIEEEERLAREAEKRKKELEVKEEES